VLKIKGVEFVETWYGAPKCVPPDLTRLYQLLLYVVTMNGRIPIYAALRSGYTSKQIDEVVSKGFVEVSLVPKKPPKKVLTRIEKIIGKPPLHMFV